MKLDFFSLLPNLSKFLITVLIAGAIGFFNKQPIVMIFILMVSMTQMVSLVFSVHEKNGVDRLYGTLPLTKFEMVVGRYCFAFLSGVFVIIVGLLLIFISMAISIPFDLNELFMILAISFLYFAFSVAVSFPIYFKLPFSKAHMFTMLPMLLFFVLIVVFAGNLDGAEGLIKSLMKNGSLLFVSLVIVGILLLSISAGIAYKIRENREI